MSLGREIVESELVTITWTHAGQSSTTAAVKVKEVFPGIDGRVAVVLVLDEAAAVTEVPWEFHACPGEHKPVQHRDGKPPWCNLCGRDVFGRLQVAGA